MTDPAHLGSSLALGWSPTNRILELSGVNGDFNAVAMDPDGSHVVRFTRRAVRWRTHASAISGLTVYWTPLR